MADCKNASVVKWWNVFYEVILRQLYLAGAVYLPNIGWIELKKREGKVFNRKRQDGTIEVVDVPTFNIIRYFGNCLCFMEGNDKVLVHCMSQSGNISDSKGEFDDI